MNWQPIETAPKDGTEILLCMPGGQSDHFYVVHWSGEIDWGGDEADSANKAWRSRHQCNEEVITEEAIAKCHLCPMWCELEAPPTSLCYQTEEEIKANAEFVEKMRLKADVDAHCLKSGVKYFAEQDAHPNGVHHA